MRQTERVVSGLWLYAIGRAGHPLPERVEAIDSSGKVESIVEGDDDLTDAQTTVVELARSLGLSELEPRSYLRMALERRAATSDV